MAEKAEEYYSYIQQKYRGASSTWKWRLTAQTTLQSLVLAGAASVPVLLSISDIPKLLPTIISGFVAIMTVLLRYYNWGEGWRVHRLTAESLKRELDLYDLSVGSYRNLAQEEAFSLFVEKTQQILDERTKKIFSIEDEKTSEQK